MKRNESLISGPIGSALLAFVVPLMLSSLVQQLYVTADAVIVGRIAGKTALAAIDSVHTLFRFPINFMNGLAAGATILISRHFGAENRDGVRSCMLSAGALAVVLGILCAVGGVLLTPVLLQFMQVPEDIYAQTLEYTRIYFGGIWAMILYNMASGVLPCPLEIPKVPCIFCWSVRLSTLWETFCWWAGWGWEPQVRRSQRFLPRWSVRQWHCGWQGKNCRKGSAHGGSGGGWNTCGPWYGPAFRWHCNRCCSRWPIPLCRQR